MSIHHKPTIFLRAVDPEKIREKYLNGGYKDSTFGTERVVERKAANVLREIRSTDPRDPIYIINTGKISTTECYGTCAGYADFAREKLKVRGRCEWCGGKAKMAYPLKWVENYSLIDDKFVVKNIFWMIGRVCDFSCALSTVQRKIRLGEIDSQAISYLRYLFKLIHPGEELTPALDPLLLEENGGALTEEQWRSKKFLFEATGTVILLPAKMEFVARK